jgi:Ferritin-like
MNNPEIKLIPRNAPAFRKSSTPNPQPRLVAGNPISTRLESGIGNCFPGLECDLRNLERRFFPFLEMDMPDNTIDLVKVDMAGALAARQAGQITKERLLAYQTLNAGGKWTVDAMTGHFGPLGKLSFKLQALGVPSTGRDRLPADPWTAVRLLTEGSPVELVLTRVGPKSGSKKVTLTANRESYLGDDGALAEMFAPGELTQSLCSPWTHDFRDCACYYWASNHPDITMPPLPTENTTDPKWNVEVPWERRDRRLGLVPPPATEKDPERVEMKHYEINRRWQELNFVLDRREQIRPYLQRPVKAAVPLPDTDTLIKHLRYAAGVELAVVQEYLAAAYSLKLDAKIPDLGDSLRAAQAQIMQIAIGEMRHLRAVNDALATLVGRANYEPALGVAIELPGKTPGSWLAVKPTALTKEALQQFIDIEAPSESVDGIYTPILDTLEAGKLFDKKKINDTIQAIRTVMAEGADHYQIFRAIQEWLLPYKDEECLRATAPPPADIVEKQTLQRRYETLLNLLHDGYKAGMPFGAADLNSARSLMIGNPRDKLGQSGGIIVAAEELANKGYLLVFDPPSDKKFAPVPHP